ncbi:MAG: DUF2017 family protein [Nocardioides sp.]
MIDVELEADAAETWLRTLTDIQLALATQLGVEEGDEGLLAGPAGRGRTAARRRVRVGRLPARPWSGPVAGVERGSARLSGSVDAGVLCGRH